ncbi:MAG: hypothetical protein C0630_11645 [Sedimenticola selenatireducens]|uniref:Uncharacterized protein n=1 Tax=Sedimenticola selenatireducens TaxID=191960 RepID=A0A2N6CV28_9GAMM|nr:MAG: hypothetical protein C0630_11645 [Sedimenticola selenatireducens]
MTIDDTLNLLEKPQPFGNEVESCITLHDFIRDEATVALKRTSFAPCWMLLISPHVCVLCN